MKTNIIIFVISLLLLPFIIGCATILRGYEDEVIIQNAPEGLKVFTKDSIEVPITKVIKTVSNKDARKDLSNIYKNIEVQEISVRSNMDHVLILKHDGREKRIYIYPKINTGWFILDALLVVPLGIDAYTGNWNSFDDIDGSF
jgi:hypothetical protein